MFHQGGEELKEHLQLQREGRGGEGRRGEGGREERGGERGRRGEGRGGKGGAGDDVRETSVSSHCESWTIACAMTNHFFVPDKVSPALLHPLEEDVEDPKGVGREEDEDRCEMW